MERTRIVRINRINRLAVHSGRFNGVGSMAEPVGRARRGRSMVPIAATAGEGKVPVIFYPAKPETREVNFEYSNPKAKSVYVAGSFNNWNAKASSLRNVGAGEWSLQMLLEPGRYEYRFVVNGKWTIDPAARQQVSNLCGSVNSVLVVE